MALISLIIGSYLLGNLLTGSVISTFYYNQEIRTKGSGNPGARNVGRLYGRKAFVVTFLGDALKGAIAVLAARYLGFNQLIELLLLLSVVAGHIYPILFKFRGGKGVSTFIGGLLVFSPLVFATFFGVFAALYIVIKNFTAAGISAIVSLPIILLVFSYHTQFLLLACLLSGIILVAHREDLTLKRRTGN
ncbi:glycerol-3-phosphate acyltransferase [Sporosarcina sp. Marseille-Q4063]|uniref:glycerol-3-phosphate acyltransferase n=1 Tax=Sporosarcina sp. Marseille-Q4063 TaxID=2810514 RepID=UPI001BB0500C|nr:glycerol-3-phosphate acyltransferase [Sporosarcina sp. Marseille-Q4063]QUW20542.1 glycerol-3-phosphate acyltransferase [Sporosarcina sp. Marseille-Q4063]